MANTLQPDLVEIASKLNETNRVLGELLQKKSTPTPRELRRLLARAIGSAELISKLIPTD